jgi:hypothetical protein
MFFMYPHTPARKLSAISALSCNPGGSSYLRRSVADTILQGWSNHSGSTRLCLAVCCTSVWGDRLRVTKPPHLCIVLQPWRVVILAQVCRRHNPASSTHKLLVVIALECFVAATPSAAKKNTTKQCNCTHKHPLCNVVTRMLSRQQMGNIDHLITAQQLPNQPTSTHRAMMTQQLAPNEINMYCLTNMDQPTTGQHQLTRP